MKHINVEKLKDEIESISMIPQTSADYNDGRNDIKMMILDIIDSLQQEQSEMDLEKEIIRVSKNEYFDFTDWKSIARHFFELGLKAQKGE